LVVLAALLLVFRPKPAIEVAVDPQPIVEPGAQPAVEARVVEVAPVERAIAEPEEPQPSEPPAEPRERLADADRTRVSKRARAKTDKTQTIEAEQPALAAPAAPDMETLRLRLIETKQTLSARAPDLPADRSRELERRWLDVRRDLRSELSERELRRLAERITALQNDINAE
jgi:hypothetical protein